MNLNEAKSMLAQSVTCEIDMLQMGNLDCADIMLNYRHSAQLRLYIVECLLGDYPDTNKEIVEYLFEQVKELIIMIIQNNC
jgi:hypothetical protein